MAGKPVLEQKKLWLITEIMNLKLVYEIQGLNRLIVFPYVCQMYLPMWE